MALHPDILLQQLGSHEDRIQRVEDIVPTMARIDQTLVHLSETLDAIHQKMDISEQALKKEIVSIRDEISSIKSGLDSHDKLIQSLDDERQTREIAIKGTAKWVGTLITAVLTAIATAGSIALFHLK